MGEKIQTENQGPRKEEIPNLSYETDYGGKQTHIEDQTQERVTSVTVPKNFENESGISESKSPFQEINKEILTEGRLHAATSGLKNLGLPKGDTAVINLGPPKAQSHSKMPEGENPGPNQHSSEQDLPPLGLQNNATHFPSTPPESLKIGPKQIEAEAEATPKSLKRKLPSTDSPIKKVLARNTLFPFCLIFPREKR